MLLRKTEANPFIAGCSLIPDERKCAEFTFGIDTGICLRAAPSPVAGIAAGATVGEDSTLGRNAAVPGDEACVAD